MKFYMQVESESLTFEIITCQFSFVVYNKRLRMVIDAIGGALQPEVVNGDVIKRFEAEPD